MVAVFGTECEFGITVTADSHSVCPNHRELAHALVQAVVQQHPHLKAPPPWPHYMLGQGGAIYQDGGHPEICTAECVSPRDLVAQQFALRLMLVDAAKLVGRAYGRRVGVLAANIDYAPEPHTFGYHVNLQADGALSREALNRQLAPLIVALPLIHGTGRISFDSSSPGFEISQRAGFMCKVAGKRTTDTRALITAKDESLADAQWRRVHLIAIDSPISPVAAYLVPAILWLSLRLLEHGRDIGLQFDLADPITSLRRVSCDLTLNAPLDLKNGGTTTALDILYAYHEAARDLASQSDMPDWVGHAMLVWSEIMEKLAADPFREDRLDWVGKLIILSDLLVDADLSWERLAKWLPVIAFLRQLRSGSKHVDLLDIDSAQVAARCLPQSAFGVLSPRMERNNLSWSDFPAAIRVVTRLCSVCLSYHLLGDRPWLCDGLAAGSLDANIVSESDIERAKTSPPRGTRAAIRAAEIMRLSTDQQAQAWWTRIETPSRRFIMADPSGRGAEWIEKKGKSPATHQDTGG